VQEALNKAARATPVLPRSNGGEVTFRRKFPLEADDAK
jgi:hypothetical protein